MEYNRKQIVKEWVANVTNSTTAEIENASPSVLLGIAIAYLGELLEEDITKLQQKPDSNTVDAEAFVNSSQTEDQTVTVHQLLREHFNMAIETPAEEELPLDNFTGTISDADHVLHPEMCYDELSEESTN